MYTHTISTQHIFIKYFPIKAIIEVIGFALTGIVPSSPGKEQSKKN